MIDGIVTNLLVKNMSFNMVNKFNINIFVSVITLALLVIFPQFIYGQECDLESEMEIGVANFRNAQFKEALPHFEKISKVLSQTHDEEVLPVIYFFCQSCKLYSGDIAGSISYGEKAINFNTLSREYQIQVLKSLLIAYDELALQDKCDNTIEKINLLWKTYKVSDVIETLVSYYTSHEEYTKVISREADLQYFDNIDASTEIDQTSNTIQLNTIYMCMAKAFSELKDYKKSISYLAKCLETLTPYTQENKSTIYLMMADNYNKLGDKKLALKYQKLAFETE